MSDFCNVYIHKIQLSKVKAITSILYKIERYCSKSMKKVLQTIYSYGDQVEWWQFSPSICLIYKKYKDIIIEGYTLNQKKKDWPYDN